MAALNLVMEEFSDDPKKAKDVDQQAFTILRDFLQPDSKTSLNSASTSVLAFLPDKDPDGSSVSLFGEVCIELAEQIPYSHPSQLKLVRLLQELSTSPKVTTNLGNARYFPFRRLGESFRDNLSFPDSENLSAWVNFHSFVAKVELHVWPALAKPTWAIWALRDAFEQDDKYYPSPAVRETYVLAAAQYVLYKGQDIVQHIVYPGDISSLDEQHWAPGPRYSGSARLDLSRWHFWKDGFAAEAASGTASDEVKTVVGKAAKLMDALEEATLGLPGN